MKPVTVRQLARLSGVSVRTLHHYDRLGLLRPAHVGANGYRYYGLAELLRLQQILLHRQFGLSLRDVGAMLDAATGSRVDVLKRQRAKLSGALERQQAVLATLDRKIAYLEGDAGMSAEELFKGFESPKQAEYEAWLIETRGPAMRAAVDASREHLRGADPAVVAERMAELARVESSLAAACRAGTPPDSASLAPLVERHRRWVSSMWGRECAPAAHAGLADLYRSHPDFVARYERLQACFAQYLSDAMRANASRAAG